MHFWPDQWEAVAAGEPITFRGPGLLGDMEKGSEGGGGMPFLKALQIRWTPFCLRWEGYPSAWRVEDRDEAFLPVSEICGESAMCQLLETPNGQKKKWLLLSWVLKCLWFSEMDTQ